MADDLIRRWQEAGLEEHTLPSGQRVKVRRPDPRHLITTGELPVELAKRFDDVNLDDGSEVDDAALVPLRQMGGLLAAAAVCQLPEADGTWRWTRLLADDFNALPPADQSWLWDYATKKPQRMSTAVDIESEPASAPDEVAA
jgi:hypothetical protein